MLLQPTYCLTFTRDLPDEGLSTQAAPGTLKNFLHPSEALIEISGSNSGSVIPEQALPNLVEVTATLSLWKFSGCKAAAQTSFLNERIKDESFYQQRPGDAGGHGAHACPWGLQPRRRYRHRSGWQRNHRQYRRRKRNDRRRHQRHQWDYRHDRYRHQQIKRSSERASSKLRSIPVLL